MSVSSNIVQLRERRGLNQKELAESLGMNRSVLNRIENGTRPVRDDELKLFADYFNVSADYLLGRESSSCSLSSPQKTLLSLFDGLNCEGQNVIMTILGSLKISHPKKAKENMRNVRNSNNGNNYGSVGGNFTATVTLG